MWNDAARDDDGRRCGEDAMMGACLTLNHDVYNARRSRDLCSLGAWFLAATGTGGGAGGGVRDYEFK